jgi:hypothetical protein
MNIIELHLLGQGLMKTGEEGPSEGLPAVPLAVQRPLCKH